jgi:hypothetical protein
MFWAAKAFVLERSFQTTFGADASLRFSKLRIVRATLI